MKICVPDTRLWRRPVSGSMVVQCCTGTKPVKLKIAGVHVQSNSKSVPPGAPIIDAKTIKTSLKFILQSFLEYWNAFDQLYFLGISIPNS